MLLLHGAVLPLAHIRRTQTRPPIFLRICGRLQVDTRLELRFNNV